MKASNMPVLNEQFEELKDKLRQEEDFCAIIESLALAEKMNFTILVCETTIQAKAALEVMEDAVNSTRGQPSEWVHFSFERKEEKRPSFEELASQILEPLYYWQNKDEKDRVFVIDGSGESEEDGDEWNIFFQRMNEVRNILMERLPGPLVLIIPSCFEAEFPRRAPDFWSVRSGFARAKAQLTEPPPLRKYLEKEKERYGTMQLWRLASPVTVADIFTRVNVLKTRSAFCCDPKERLEETFRGKAGFGDVLEEGKDAMDAVRDEQKLFILGKPGAGKTTFLKHVAMKAADGELDYIPIFIPLRNFSESGRSLYDFIADEFESCGFPNPRGFMENLLKEGKAILLCDGLDEVNKEDDLRKQVIGEVINFSKTYKDGKVVITCRIAASEYLFEDFVYVEIADFDKSQLKTFVYKWFTGKYQTADKFLKEFYEIRNDRLRDLAKNPLLLTLLCIGFEETLSFPSRRSEIYEEAIDALLRKWDASRGIKRDDIYRHLSLGRKRQMFARIAYESFEKGEYLIEQKHMGEKIVSYLKNLPQADSQEEIDGIAVIKAVESQHGIFVERAQGIYSFSHLTFQEYYTAKYIVSNIHKSALENLIRNHFTDENWREVFLLTAEMLDDADEFFEILLNMLDQSRYRTLARSIDRTRDTALDIIIDYAHLVDSLKKGQAIKDYKFTKEEAKKIEQYLYGTKLLIDCLEVAYVSDRNRIEERLLRPPKRFEPQITSDSTDFTD
ncbi:NACHT domain-containing protein [Desulfococcaceae bacterium HSG8]|nr:NACHT domain-containing protein [Desulfococcaceae bacterium HSG8]